MRSVFPILFWTTLFTACFATSLTSLSRDLARVESLRAIKNVQKTFAQLGQFGRYDQMASLFSANGTLIWGNTTIRTPSSISSYLTTASRGMNGIAPGSLDTWVIETPLISLSASGTSAKGRWNGLRFQGDGKGGTWIQGGIYENEYVLVDGEGWKISVLKYYAMYEGNYEKGWRNIGGKGLPVVPYHFTPEGSGVPIPGFDFDGEYGGDENDEGSEDADVEDLERRIRKLNDEDDVRNLMHAHGYYVDRRMWTDIIDLHTDDTTVIVRNGANYTGKAGVRQVLERMGPENLTRGINNDYPIFDMIVEVNDNGREAIARGVEIAMIGNTNNKTASWEFNVFRNHFVKEDGIWKVEVVDTTPLIVADYFKGWGNGGIKAPNSYVPPFLNVTAPPSRFNSTAKRDRNQLTKRDLADLHRWLLRSLTFDGSENQSAGYGYFLDDLDCSRMGSLFARRGHKASPFAGFYVTPQRITDACFASWGNNHSALRNGISFHWRPQPVILVSEDGRSATLRARLLQPNTAVDKAGAFNSAIYHDQIVLEPSNSTSTSLYRLWDVTIDEFYWSSTSWKDGWSNPPPRNASAPDPEPASWTRKYPPDLSVAGVGERESTFRGGSGKYIEWPEIQRMWFGYKNLVSGRKPEWYWPGCVPCKAKPDWSLESSGYQEPVPGPRRAEGGDGRRAV